MAIDLSKIKGIIFDMDGVLVDSEPVMAKASVLGMADYGVQANPEDFVPFFGTNDETYFGSVVRMHGGTELHDTPFRLGLASLLWSPPVVCQATRAFFSCGGRENHR